MPRLLAAALFLFGWTFLAAADEPPSRRAVDLNEPGALELWIRWRASRMASER